MRNKYTEVSPNCISCNGSCCRDMTFPGISEAEISILTLNKYISIYQYIGVESETTFLKANEVGIHIIRTKYGNCLKIVGECGNLKEGLCSIYEQRPRGCRDFELGSQNCKILYLSSMLKQSRQL